jgi:hypothetical protein
MKTKKRIKKVNENKRKSTKKYNGGGECSLENNAVSITYGGILGCLRNIFKVENLELGNTIMNVVSGFFRGKSGLPDQIKLITSIYTLYLIILNIVDPNYLKTDEGGNEFNTILKDKNENDFNDIQQFRLILQKVYILETDMQTYKKETERFHKRLLLNEFVKLLKIIREANNNNNNNLYLDFEIDQNKLLIQPYLDHFYTFSLNFVEQTIKLDFRNLGRMLDSATHLNQYYNLFKNIYILSMHRLMFLTDSDFVEYECPETGNSEDPIGIVNHDTWNTILPCDILKIARDNHNLENSLKYVLETLFGANISQGIKYYPLRITHNKKK